MQQPNRIAIALLAVMLCFTECNKRPVHSFEFVAGLPIDSGSCLSVHNDFDWELPNDFHVCGNTIYMLSSLEKKVLCLDLSTKKFDVLRNISLRMASEKDGYGEIDHPYLMCVTDNFIVITYLRKLLVFSKDQTHSY